MDSWEIFLGSNSLKRKFLRTHLYEDSGSILGLLSTIPYEPHSLENPEATFLLSVTSMLSIQASEGLILFW